MKAHVGALALIGAVLLAGSALAQIAPQPRSEASPAHSGASAPPAVRGQSGSEHEEMRANVNSSGAVLASEASVTVNDIGGAGGGRMSIRNYPENEAVRATANSSSGPIDIESWSWGRIDRVNTVEACTARRGVVLMHEGVQQCRLPATRQIRP